MNNNPNQPREYDAVLGGEAPPPVHGVILGGLEGVRNRLKSSVVEVQMNALSEALNYGDIGLDLVINNLTNYSEQVQRFAAKLLKQRGGDKGKQALLNSDPYLAFIMMTNWLVEEFNSEVGIKNPEITAYSLNLQLDWSPLYTKVRSIVKSGSGLSFRAETHRLDREETTKKFQTFLHNPQSHQIQALHCHYPSHCFIDIFIEAKNQLSNLRALFWGDPQDDPYKDTSIHKLTRNMSLILEAYPNLEVLHIRGNADGDNYDPFEGSCLSFTLAEHHHLKTLIIETSCLPRSAVNEIVNLNLPNLEYLELWTGNAGFDAVSLIPKISEQFPKLKYLGIRSCEDADEVAKALVSSPLIERLKILDLSMGEMTNQGVEYLLNCPAVNQLHTLNLSMNYISNTEVLDQLVCHVIAQPQDGEYGDRYYALHE
ncbi:leucine rich repeat variant [Nostoc commune NIES-4072]|uniref:Leucine rich repeat variant n=1 Tax=Nostoc commune NIES-4072 TaxID=2005467 RepID=A0A2R5FW60_NOSCO|nr:hypothetical protein [Nostoc commune]BBD70352.1 leucine rich repeat variant [Nostoc commune HK-02]GBG23006.1 leucine rich repeat variant [Nostoc commune NIES-4072]